MNFDLSPYIPKEILEIVPYRSAANDRAELESESSAIWIDANEAPEGLKKDYNRYPEQQPQAISAYMSEIYDIAKENIVITRGIDEGIDLVLKLFGGIDASLVIMPPTYGYYKSSAILHRKKLVEFPLTKSGLLNCKPCDIEADSILMFCRPNNPTGTLIDASEILEFVKQLEGKAMVVVDEAYIEFSEAESLVREVNNYANLVVLRTLSKAQGLAGLRLGAIVTNRQLCEYFRAILPPYPIALPVILAFEELESELKEFRQKMIEQIIGERERLMSRLEHLSFVKYIYASRSNFILLEVEDATKLVDRLRANSILIRNRSREIMNTVRISVGSQIENDELIRCMESLCEFTMAN